MRRVLLLAPDSKIPNLALMKLSTYYKWQGDIVGMNVDEPDLIYCSLMFSKSRYHSAGLLYPEAKIIYGGPGFDPKVRLPMEVESCPPDQDLYQSKFSVGKVTTGCPRRCPFCMVHLMEPEGIRYIQPPDKIWKPGTILRLLDDNILAMPEAFWEVFEFQQKTDLKIHIEYLDIRFITLDIAKALKKMKHNRGIWFSFDFTETEKAVRRGVQNLFDAGVNKFSIHVLIYCDGEHEIEDAKYRWKIIRDELDLEPFLMVNDDNITPRLREIRRRGTRPAAWRNLTAEEVFE